MGSVYWPDFCGNRSEYDAFWSNSLTLETSNPDLTVCFQRTALSWPPTVLLAIFGPLHLWSINDKRRINKLSQFSWLNLTKTIICLLQILASILMIVWVARPTTTGDTYATPADYVATSLRLITLIVVFLLLRWDFMKGVCTSGILCCFWLLHLILEIFQCRSNAMRNGVEGIGQDTSYFITYNIYFACVILQFLLTFIADSVYKTSASKVAPHIVEDKQEKQQYKEEDSIEPEACREDLVNFWAKLTFQWLVRDVFRAYKNPITFGGLYDLRPKFKCDYLVEKFRRNYYKQDKVKESSAETSTAQPPHRPLWIALLSCVANDYVPAVIIRTLSIPFAFINPQLLSLLINFVGSDDPYVWKGIVLAGTMLVVNFTYSVLLNNFLHLAFAAGTKARSIVNAIVYRKALRLSSTARKQASTGQIVNLMTVDSQKIQDMYLYVTLMLTVPLTLAVTVYFLWQVIGPSCLSGFAVLLILVLFNTTYLADKAYGYQKIQMHHKDKRFRVMNEILAGMKVLKLYAWEPSFENKINGFRDKELETIKWINSINAFNAVSSLITPYLVSLAIFATYVLVDETNVLTADKAFVTISMINILNWPLNFMPLAVANTSQGIVSIRRTQEFLDLDELEEDGPNADSNLEEGKVEFDNATLSWGREEEPTLTDIDLKVPSGGLVAVVGTVGSGKSSLINAVLGEMFAQKGKISYNGSLAYVPQQAWIVHNSLKENIMFGKPDDKRKYKDVVKACALERDLAMLPGGDETEIGEKGTNLSGGQKQRVSLARAVYQDEDIYLLDDPLSAVDAHVGKHIFEHVIGPTGVLNQKTRILVTHGIKYLPFCDVIVVLKDGKIEEMGKYDELVETDGAFAEVIKTYLENETLEEEDEKETGGISEKLPYLSNPDTHSIAGSISLASEVEFPSRPLSYSRQISQKSYTSQKSHVSKAVSKTDDTEDANKGVQLVQEEKEETGSVSLSVAKSYLKACGYLLTNVVVWCHLLYMVFQILTNLWLTVWTSDTADNAVNATYDRSLALYRLSVYGYLGIGQVIMATIAAFAVASGCYSASRVLHQVLLCRIMRAPMSFFDTTPLGRIINRFSKDLDIVDTNMPIFIRLWLFSVAPVFITITLICCSTPIFAAVFIPLAVLYVLVQRVYVKPMRQWKRIDSVRRSPIYVHMDESASGCTSIRAYGRGEEFVKTCDRLIDESQRPWYMVLTGYRWCSVSMEMVGAWIVFFASLFAVLQRDTISAGMAGVSVTYALQVTSHMNGVIRTSTELESFAISVERIQEYIHTDGEAPWVIEDKSPPKDWPQEGAIELSEYSTRYREGLDLVLKNLSCLFKAGERIGIVGRTGAGKSSLSLALFRLIEPAAGSIRIDGVSISDMGLHSLRSQISIIPQDPVVFSGTLRSNLDPFDLYTDHEVWQALEHAHLKDFVSETEEALEYECGENGEALSVGQRQLLCLARALLRKSKILVLDEATAAVDFETDSLIQTTIREKFQHCTILTVAHRLNTVLDYDRIMVLSEGQIIELDTPNNLMEDRSSVFYSMAMDAGLA